MNIVKGDLVKKLKMQLLKGDEPFAFLEDDVITLRWSIGKFTSMYTEVTPTVLDAQNGELSYEFQPGETDTVGNYYGQITVRRDEQTISFPDNGDFIRWRVRARL